MSRKRVPVPDCLKWTFEDLDRELAEMFRKEEEQQRRDAELSWLNKAREAESSSRNNSGERQLKDSRAKSLIEFCSSATPNNNRKVCSVSNFSRSPTGSILSRGQDFLTSIFRYNERKDNFEQVIFRNHSRPLPSSLSIK